MDKYLLDNDILVDYLTSTDYLDSHLINLMQKGICYTTVLNAAELLASCKDEMKKNWFEMSWIHSKY